MPASFETPHDATHAFSDPTSDWRSGGGIAGAADRFTGYGNWAGVGNRMETENKDYLAAERAANPQYDPYSDPKLANDPRYAPVDGIDAAAKKHDQAYDHDLGKGNTWGSYQGMHNVREDDRRLVGDVQKEMDAHGSEYSPLAQTYSEGLRGFFGGRVEGQDAIDWAGQRASAFGHEGIGQWLGETGSQAVHGISSAAHTAAALGPTGVAATVAGLGDAAIASTSHAVKQLFGFLSD